MSNLPLNYRLTMSYLLSDCVTVDLEVETWRFLLSAALFSELEWEHRSFDEERCPPLPPVGGSMAPEDTYQEFVLNSRVKNI